MMGYKFQHIHRPTKKAPRIEHVPVLAESVPERSPYDHVPILIGDRISPGRPIAFDQEPVPPLFLGADGEQVRPTSLSTSCPFCGHGLVVAVAPTDDLGALKAGCTNCEVGLVKEPELLPEPFCNPIATGMITDLDTTVTSIADLERGIVTPKGKISSPIDLGPEPE